MSASKNWSALEAIRVAIAHVAPVAAPNLYQFQSQLAAVALFIGTLFSPTAQHLLACGPCRALGRLSFGVYLVHFPILFTLACAGFLGLANAQPYPARRYHHRCRLRLAGPDRRGGVRALDRSPGHPAQPHPGAA